MGLIDLKRIFGGQPSKEDPFKRADENQAFARPEPKPGLKLDPGQELKTKPEPKPGPEQKPEIDIFGERTKAKKLIKLAEKAPGNIPGGGWLDKEDRTAAVEALKERGVFDRYGKLRTDKFEKEYGKMRREATRAGDTRTVRFLENLREIGKKN